MPRRPVAVHKISFLLIFVLIVTWLPAQVTILPNAFAHNDYFHKRPLMDALSNGFTYVEADVYLRKGNLVVAHILPCFKKKRTLEKLYLQPLLDFVKSSAAEQRQYPVHNCPLTLMIDIKSDAEATGKVLLQLLEKYQDILTVYENGCTTFRNVTIVLSGNKPYELVRNQQKRFVFIDEDLRKAAIDSTPDLYPIASCKYSRLLKWKGKGTIPEADLKRLEYYVIEAHKNGRKVRLWASPENKKVWSELLKCNVDLINTNKLTGLRKFLLSEEAELVQRETLAEPNSSSN